MSQASGPTEELTLSLSSTLSHCVPYLNHRTKKLFERLFSQFSSRLYTTSTIPDALEKSNAFTYNGCLMISGINSLMEIRPRKAPLSSVVTEWKISEALSAEEPLN